MKHAVRRWLIGLSVPMLAAACGSGQATVAVTSAQPTTTVAAAATSTPTTLSVTSSIADGSSLAEPVAWTATPSSLDGIEHVDFLVDGVVKWTENKTPYFFNDDYNLLHPWLLGLGAHVLTVQAVTQSGAQANSTAHVTVTAGPQVPAALAGTFTRSVTPEDIARTQAYRTGGHVPPGMWTARFQPTGLIVFDDPNGSGGDEALRATPTGALALGGPVNWLETKDRRGGFCEPEVPGLYHWSVTGRTLTITGDDKKCADRDAVFIGNWTQS
jgi:hypothetical protein